MASDQSISDLIPSWVRSLRAGNRSERTIDAYLLAANQLVAFLADHNLHNAPDEIEASHVRDYLAHVLANRAAATARQRHGSLLQFFKWMVEEDEIAANPMRNVKPPKVIQQPPPVFTDDELRRLLRACAGKDFTDRRDEAIVRLFIDTGMRLGELAGLTIDTIDLDLEVAIVLGKGRRFRTVPFGKATTKALDR